MCVCACVYMCVCMCVCMCMCMCVHVCAYTPIIASSSSHTITQVVCSNGGVLCVDLLLPPTHSPISVIGRLVRMGHVTPRKKTAKTTPNYPPFCTSLRPGEEVEVVVSSTDSPSSFYVQLVSCHGDLKLSLQLGCLLYCLYQRWMPTRLLLTCVASFRQK